MKYAVLIALFAGFIANCAVIVPLSEDEVIDSSGLVIYGEVVDKESNWGIEGKLIFTDYKVRIEDFLYPCDRYGTDDECIIDETLTDSPVHMTLKENGSYYVFVRTPGGSVAGIGMKIPGAPSFRTGQKMVFLLRARKAQGDEGSIFGVVGFSQGVCRVEKGEGAEKLLCGFAKREPAFTKVSVRSVGTAVSGKKTGVRRSKNLKEFREKLHKRFQRKK